MPPYSPDRDAWSIEATERLFPPVAKDVFKTRPENIDYAWRCPEMDRMDKHYGTDAVLQSANRNVAIAIRLRGRYYFDEFGDITIRLDSLQTLGKKLEMQKSIARLMFYGWGDTNSPGLPKKLIKSKSNPYGVIDPATIAPPTKLVDWYVVWLQRLIDVFLKGELRYKGPFANVDKSSRLVGINIAELGRHGLIYQKSGEATEEQEDIWERSELIYEQQRLFELDEAYHNELQHAPWTYD